MPKVNREVTEAAIQKAVANLAMLSTGGRLNTEQSKQFIRMITDQPTILNEARTVSFVGDSKKIEKIGFGQRVLTPGEEGKDPGEDKYAAPTTGTVKLETKEVIAVVKITDDTLENNIEGTSIEDTIMKMLSERVALDLEELIVNGNKTSGKDDYLKLIDGLLAQIDNHVVDGKGEAISKNVFKGAKKILPSKYLRNPRDWRFYVSYNAETDWTDLVGERQTNVGDDAFINGTVKPAYGIPVKGIAMLQEYDNSGTQVSDAILTNPKNIVVGISRDIRIETERKPRERANYIIVTLKLDVKLEEKDAAVKITKIKA